MERRQFHRILFEADAQLIQGQSKWPATLVDLSLKGALLELRMSDALDAGQPLELNILLQGSEVQINMQGTISHKEPHKVGFHCSDIDIDSATELRRVMELNLADEDLLQRDIHALVD